MLYTEVYTNTHTQYVIVIASSLQKWLNQRPSLLRLTYIACVATRNTNATIGTTSCVCMELPTYVQWDNAVTDGDTN